MSNTNTSYSYSNFIYIFPAAAWVAQTLELFKVTSNYFAVVLALILFSFIPAEIYATNLWARERNGNLKRNRSFWTTVVDIVGVFFLSTLYLVYPSIDSLFEGKTNISQVKLLFIGLGMLLFLNALWNLIDRPKDIDAFRNAQLLAEKKRTEAYDGISVRWYSFVSWLIPWFQKLNFIFFGIISPSLGITLVLSVLISDALGYPDIFGLPQSGWSKTVAILLVSYLALLTCWKLWHTFLLTYIKQRVADLNPRHSPVLLEINGENLSVVAIGDDAIARVSQFRFQCMTEDIFHMSKTQNNKRYAPNGLRHYSRNDIAYDEWDDNAIHIVVQNNNNIIGSIRVNFSISGMLPFLNHLRTKDQINLDISKDDIEISRYFVSRQHRKSYVASALLFGAAHLLSLLHDNTEGRVFADVLLDKNDLLNIHTYCRAGFVPTKAEYWDYRFDGRSRIYSLDISNKLSEYYQKSRRNYLRAVRISR